MSDFDELIRDARKELRRASGEPLTAEEKDEDLHKTQVDELDKFILRKLGVGPLIMLLGKAAWTPRKYLRFGGQRPADQKEAVEAGMVRL